MLPLYALGKIIEKICIFTRNNSPILRGKKWENFDKNTTISRNFLVIFPSVHDLSRY